MNFEIEWRGHVDYQTAFLEQQHNFINRKAVIWGLEHPLVVTVGKRALKNYHNQILGSLPIVETDRGGQLTLHNEGQLIIYPQFDLSNFGWGVKEYVEILLNTTHRVLTDCGVECFIDFKEGGVFTSNGKIASVGLRVQSHWVYHGLAINIKNDLLPFQAISACGLWNRPQDRVSNWNPNVDLKKIFEQWVQCFSHRTTN